MGTRVSMVTLKKSKHCLPMEFSVIVTSCWCQVWCHMNPTSPLTSPWVWLFSPRYRWDISTDPDIGETLDYQGIVKELKRNFGKVTFNATRKWQGIYQWQNRKENGGKQERAVNCEVLKWHIYMYINYCITVTMKWIWKWILKLLSERYNPLFNLKLLVKPSILIWREALFS